MFEEHALRATDFAFFANDSFMRADEESRRSDVPIEKLVKITDDIYIQKMPKGVWEMVADSCTLSGVVNATRQFSQLYAFVREFDKCPEGHDRTVWDNDERLQICIGLSRIIHPTTISFGYSGRTLWEGEKIIEVISGPATGFGARAWVSSDEWRNWLTADDARELSALARAFFRPDSQLCTRVKQSLWYLEYAYRTEFLDIRWPLVCMGLECLIHTDKWNSTLQFKKRVSKMAEQVGVQDFPENKAEEAYDMRCALAHGKLLRDMGQTKQKLYEKAEDVLRLAIKRAILEPPYNLMFSNNEIIRECFPL